MSLNKSEIVKLLKSGKPVYWKHTNYEVVYTENPWGVSLWVILVGSNARNYLPDSLISLCYTV